jgi:hypothetical protein
LSSKVNYFFNIIINNFDISIDKINEILAFGESKKTESFVHNTQPHYNKDLKESNTDSTSSMGINLASFKDSIILINFNKYDANKCQRCWKLEQELNQDSLCIRCQKATN